jgi:DNA topoisomerase-1
MNETIFKPVSGAAAKAKMPELKKTAELVYVSDTAEGIVREKGNGGFVYRLQGKKLRDRKELERIRKLAIPPAWTGVWICTNPNGHIQAIGFDAKNRKQYKYHTAWTELRNQNKFQRLYAFGKKLPQLRVRLQKDLTMKELTLEKVLALIISLMEHTYIRIGNNGYEKLYGSYGLTTLKDQHVKIEGNQIRFSFKGKKGIHHKISLKNRKLADIVKQCREIPGKELFQYYDENDVQHTIHSEHVNAYIKELTGEDYTAKDFRTWAGSVHAVDSLLKMGQAETAKGCQENINKSLDYVSGKLGNTRSVCKKYYVHPIIMELYEKGKLFQYGGNAEPLEHLSAEEVVLLDILEEK